MNIIMPDWDVWLGDDWHKRARGPRSLNLTDVQIVHLHKYIKQVMDQLNYTEKDLAVAINCSPFQIGRISGDRKFKLMHPSWRFIKKFAVFVLTNPERKPDWAPSLIYSKSTHDAILMEKVKITPTQCVECVHEMREGMREEKDTWWIKNPKAKFCTSAHKSKYHKREGKIERGLKRYAKAELEFDNLFYGS